MTCTVDLFIDSDQPLGQLAARLSDLLGQELSPSPDARRFVLRDGEVTAYLAEHDFVDDEDLPLSEFRYVLSAAVRGRGRAEESEEITCLRRVNAVLRETTGLPSLLVVDLERPAPGREDERLP
jgi:hypothetical protein